MKALKLEKTYRGYRRTDGSCVVQVGRRRELPLRLDLRNHSPTGFEWGYGGSGPAQLALAILADCIGDKEALEVYQQFKREVVCGLPHAFWQLREKEVRETVERLITLEPIL
jgi:hypothetical protein